MRLTSFCLQALALIRQNDADSALPPPIAVIRNGTISGVHCETYNQDFFLGIPYAQPPLHELRFRNPQSLNASFNATFEASSYSPECVGYGGAQIGYPVSEDCLTLNVIRPSGFEGQLLPVAVWIHGGDFLMGGSRDKRYNLSFIVENGVHIDKPFIGISINYRLDTWGFISSQEVSGSGNTNLGLKDQRLALHWIQQNIEAFGGDRSKVTIWGESAGAQSVGFHITAYNGRDDHLFRAAIMESGNPINYNSFRTTDFYQAAYDALVQQTSCSASTDILNCLRNVPFNTLNDVLNGLGTYWQPVVDGDLIARWTSIQLDEGAFVHVPVIVGATTDEGTLWAEKGINTSAQFKHYSEHNPYVNLPKQFGDDLLQAYPNVPAYWAPSTSEVPADAVLPPGFGAQCRRNAAYETDSEIVALRRKTCETCSKLGLDAYSYRFNTQPAGTPWWQGVPHFSEVAFVFENTNGVGYDEARGFVDPFRDKPATYKKLAVMMSRTWASFIHDGVPSVEGVVWPSYELDDPRNLVWDANDPQLVYSEPDNFRAEGIKFILEHSLNYHR